MHPYIHAGTHPDKPAMDEVLITPVREGAQDDWSRFEGASAAIGHFIRMVHEGRMTKDEGWIAICGYNAAMLRPHWPVERLKRESERLWERHVEKYGPPLIRLDSGAPGPVEMPAFRLGALLDDLIAHAPNYSDDAERIRDTLIGGGAGAQTVVTPLESLRIIEDERDSQNRTTTERPDGVAHIDFPT
jgi:hypothetical protein